MFRAACRCGQNFWPVTWDTSRSPLEAVRHAAVELLEDEVHREEPLEVEDRLAVLAEAHLGAGVVEDSVHEEHPGEHREAGVGATRWSSAVHFSVAQAWDGVQEIPMRQTWLCSQKKSATSHAVGNPKNLST